MSQCNFSIPFSMTADQVAARARMAIINAGGSFQGDASAGTFDVATPAGTIRGTYFIQTPMIQITITAKPFFVSCGMIEKQLRNYLQLAT